MTTQPFSWFFRDAPKSVSLNEHLVSSMQTFETSLYLLALKRYPHALTACASALESGIQAAPQVGATDADALVAAFTKAKAYSPLLAGILTRISGDSRMRETESLTGASAQGMTVLQYPCLSRWEFR